MFTLLIIFVLLIIIVFLSRTSSFETDKIPILVISLPGSKRREYVTNDMKENELEFTFSDGVMIQNENDIQKYLDEFDIHDLREGKFTEKFGDFGCTFAFIRAFKYIIDNNIEWTLLLEDDCILLPDGVKVFKEHPEKYKTFNGWLVVYNGLKPNLWGNVGQIISLDCAKDLWSKRKEIMESVLYVYDKQLDMLMYHHNLSQWKETTEPYIVGTYDPGMQDSERLSKNI